MIDARPRPRYSLGPAVKRFGARNLRHTKGPKILQPFVTEPWQDDDWDLIYETDENGKRLWRTVLYGVSRGCGKSPVTARAGLFELLSRHDNPEVYCTAGSKDQAALIHGFARGMVESGPLIRHIKPQRSMLILRNRPGFLKVLAADGLLQHGLSPAVWLIDEWHAFTTEKQEELTNAGETALHKRPDSVEIAISTAGFDKASQLGRRYDAMLAAPDVWAGPGIIIARDWESRSLMIWRGAPDDADIDDPATWRLGSPASWLELDEIRVLRRKLPENVFRRLILNQWTKTATAWLPNGAWAACRGDAEIPDGAGVWLGVDIGLKNDSSAVVIAYRRDDGKIIVRAKVWRPVGDGTPLDLSLVEEYIRECRDRFQVQTVAFDPHMFGRSAQMLSDEGLWMIEFPQSNERMAPASQVLYDLIVSQGIEHDGDPLFADHVAAGATTYVGDRAWRITKRKATGQIDALIALVLAVWDAAQYQGSPGVE